MESIVNAIRSLYSSTRTANNKRVEAMKKTSLIFLIAVLVSLMFGEFQPACAQSWQYIAPMNHPRVWHLALILNNGKILVMGGEDGNNGLNTCELYDPDANTWTYVASMNTPRWCFQACLLPDGKVFVAGGRTDLGNSTTSTCEIYDPIANT
jgi:N-acetylneuraminic acid mutarotase